MKTLELHNFKRFKHLKEIEMGDINILVGKCNSGKSSFSIAAMLYIDNLINLTMNREKKDDNSLNIFFARRPKYHLTADSISGLSLYKFDDILNKDNNREEIELKGGFLFGNEDENEILYVSIVVIKDSEQQFATIQKVTIESKLSKLEFIFNKGSKDELGKCLFIRDIHNKQESKYFENNTKLLDYGKDHLLIQIVKNIITQNENEHKLNNNDIDAIENLVNKLFSVLDKDFRFEAGWKATLVPAYINCFFINTDKTENTDDYVTETLNDFYNSEIELNNEDPYGKFINKMTDRFGLGYLEKVEREEQEKKEETEEQKAKLQAIKETYYLKDDKENRQSFHLCGAGTQRLVTIILRLALSIKEKSPMVFVEEPEQNLHPNLQSLLADLFFEAYLLAKKEKHNIQFIIETHSEYLVRKSQVIVRKCTDVGIDIKDVPFKTFYFPDEPDKEPYDMKYSEDGSFENDFGPGFIDESSNLALNLFLSL